MQIFGVTPFTKFITVTTLINKPAGIYPYLGLIYLGCLQIPLITLTILTCCWFCLFHNVQQTMIRTFSWELITQLLGSYYDDCIDHSQVAFPVETAPADQCNYTTTIPWIPLMGSFICLVTFASIGTVWLYRLIQRKIILKASKWKYSLIFLCMAECLHFGVGIANIYHLAEARPHLLQHMHYTLRKSEMLHDIYFRWNLTQSRSKCCGIVSASDWDFLMSRNVDPRYPISCCDTDTSHPSEQCNYFPTRYEIWKDGCYDKEVAIIQDYENLFVQLLVLSMISMLLVTMFTWLLENFLAREPLLPSGTNLTPSFWKKCFHFPSSKPGDNAGDATQAKSSINTASCRPEKDNPGGKIEAEKESIKKAKLICAAEYQDVNNVGAIKTKLCSPTRNDYVRGENQWTNIDMKPIFTRRYQTASSSSNNDLVIPVTVRKETMV